MGLFDNFRREKREKELEEFNRAMEASPVREAVVASEQAFDEAPLETISDVVVDMGDGSGMMVSGETITRASNNGNVTYTSFGYDSPTPKVESYATDLSHRHASMSTKIIAIINQKGGVGKSTTAVNLSAALGEMGKQVLLIDLDPQGNSTSGLGIEKGELSRCIYNVLLDENKIEETIVPDVCDGLDVVPATIDLAGAEVELVSEMAREQRLKDAVGTLRGKYDYIFIDCPPSLGLLTVNALVAADMLIIPIQTEFYALEGVTKLLESMKRVKSRLNPSLDIFGILLTMYDGRTTLSRQVAAEVKKYFGNQVFETIIPRTVKLSEAPSYGIPITQYDPMGKGAASYVNLAKEVIQRG